MTYARETPMNTSPTMHDRISRVGFAEEAAAVLVLNGVAASDITHGNVRVTREGNGEIKVERCYNDGKIVLWVDLVEEEAF